MNIERLVEYSIIVPLPAGIQADPETPATILATFGGYTAQTVIGAWMHEGRTYYDHSTEYRIAGPDTAITANMIRTTANTIGARLGEISMYVRFPRGNAEIITVDASTAAA